jgi:hypothetical protein
MLWKENKDLISVVKLVIRRFGATGSSARSGTIGDLIGVQCNSPSESKSLSIQRCTSV